jgi:hypothetical protein
MARERLSKAREWEVLAAQPGFAGPMRRGLEQQRREVPGTPATGEQWKAYVAAHPEEFSASIPSAKPKE